MAKPHDLVLDALSAAAAAVVTHLIVERLDVALKARKGAPQYVPQALRRGLSTSAIVHSVVAMLSFRIAAGGSRRLLSRVI
jgi:hypothetical protein